MTVVASCIILPQFSAKATIYIHVPPLNPLANSTLVRTSSVSFVLIVFPSTPLPPHRGTVCIDRSSTQVAPANACTHPNSKLNDCGLPGTHVISGGGGGFVAIRVSLCLPFCVLLPPTPLPPILGSYSKRGGRFIGLSVSGTGYAPALNRSARQYKWRRHCGYRL